MVSATLDVTFEMCNTHLKILGGPGSSHGRGEPGGVRTDLRVIFTFIILYGASTAARRSRAALTEPKGSVRARSVLP